MKIVLTHKHEKFLLKQEKGDFNGIAKVRLFLKRLETFENPTALPNCKKMQDSKKPLAMASRKL